MYTVPVLLELSSPLYSAESKAILTGINAFAVKSQSYVTVIEPPGKSVTIEDYERYYSSKLQTVSRQVLGMYKQSPHARNLIHYVICDIGTTSVDEATILVDVLTKTLRFNVILGFCDATLLQLWQNLFADKRVSNVSLRPIFLSPCSVLDTSRTRQDNATVSLSPNASVQARAVKALIGEFLSFNDIRFADLVTRPTFYTVQDHPLGIAVRQVLDDIVSPDGAPLFEIVEYKVTDFDSLLHKVEHSATEFILFLGPVSRYDQVLAHRPAGSLLLFLNGAYTHTLAGELEHMDRQDLRKVACIEYLGDLREENTKRTDLQNWILNQFGSVSTPSTLFGYDAGALSATLARQTLLSGADDAGQTRLVQTIVEDFHGITGQVVLSSDRSRRNGMASVVGYQPMFAEVHNLSQTRIWTELSFVNIQGRSVVPLRTSSVTLDLDLRQTELETFEQPQGTEAHDASSSLPRPITTDASFKPVVVLVNSHGVRTALSVETSSFVDSGTLSFETRSSVTASVHTQESYRYRFKDPAFTPILEFAEPASKYGQGLPGFTFPKDVASLYEESAVNRQETPKAIEVTVLLPRIQATSKTLLREYAYVYDAFVGDVFTVSNKHTLHIVSYPHLVSFFSGSSDQGVNDTTPSDVVASLETFLAFLLDPVLDRTTGRTKPDVSKVNIVTDGDASIFPLSSHSIREFVKEDAVRIVGINPDLVLGKTLPPHALKNLPGVGKLLVSVLYDRIKHFDQISFGSRLQYADKSTQVFFEAGFPSTDGTTFGGMLLRLRDELTKADTEIPRKLRTCVSNASLLNVLLQKSFPEPVQTNVFRPALQNIRPSAQNLNQASTANLLSESYNRVTRHLEQEFGKKHIVELFLLLANNLQVINFGDYVPVYLAQTVSSLPLKDTRAGALVSQFGNTSFEDLSLSVFPQDPLAVAALVENARSNGDAVELFVTVNSDSLAFSAQKVDPFVTNEGSVVRSDNANRSESRILRRVFGRSLTGVVNAARTRVLTRISNAADNAVFAISNSVLGQRLVTSTLSLLYSGDPELRSVLTTVEPQQVASQPTVVFVRIRPLSNRKPKLTLLFFGGTGEKTALALDFKRFPAIVPDEVDLIAVEYGQIGTIKTTPERALSELVGDEKIPRLGGPVVVAGYSLGGMYVSAFVELNERKRRSGSAHLDIKGVIYLSTLVSNCDVRLPNAVVQRPTSTQREAVLLTIAIAAVASAETGNSRLPVLQQISQAQSILQYLSNKTPTLENQARDLLLRWPKDIKCFIASSDRDAIVNPRHQQIMRFVLLASGAQVEFARVPNVPSDFTNHGIVGVDSVRAKVKTFIRNIIDAPDTDNEPVNSHRLQIFELDRNVDYASTVVSEDYVQRIRDLNARIRSSSAFFSRFLNLTA